MRPGLLPAPSPGLLNKEVAQSIGDKLFGKNSMQTLRGKYGGGGSFQRYVVSAQG
jgi:hypothetical protein